MPQHERVSQSYTRDNVSGSSPAFSLALLSSDSTCPASFTFDVIRRNLFRVTFTSPSHPLTPYPSAGKPRVDLEGYHPQVESTSNSERINIGDILATVTWNNAPLVTLSFKDSPFILHQDLPFRSYALDGLGVAHYTRYNRDTLHCGLGEKAAPMDLSERKFELSATDSFGYDVYRTDPMYKHIPLLINATPHGCLAMFSTTHSRGSYSVGAEMDGMWGRYKVYRQDYGGLEQYLIIGRTLAEVVRTYAEIVGYPRPVPRWAFGYIAGGMKYSMLDEPVWASQAIVDFARKCKDEDIPCSGFQLSSGYTVAEKEPKTRNVFTWNRHRFPDPKAWVEKMHEYGIKISANVKPYVLKTHPDYDKLRRQGALFTDPATGDTAVTRLWSAGGGESDEGSHIDFTSRAGFKWWFDGIQELGTMGIDNIWNDNNEYTIPDDDWQCKLDEPSLGAGPAAEKKEVGVLGRSLQTELMGKASHDALRDVNPDTRPSILTRSATAGTMRWCGATWSGDNVTSWATMKGANALSLNAGLSLLHYYGHDIGGFEGPQPSPELLLRWIQLGVHSPRFAINCFKTSAFIESADNKVGDVIEPWMYPSATHLIRKVIKRRYELIPYLYSLHLESQMFATPPQRWVGWGCEDDQEVWRNDVLRRGEEEYWLGDTVLVGGVYEPGVSEARVYLPKISQGHDAGYVGLNPPYQYFTSGQWVTVPSPWQESIPLFARVGGAVIVGRDVQTLSPGEKNNPANLPADNYRAVEIFPPRDSSDHKLYSATWYEDDGVSAETRISKFTIEYHISSEGGIDVEFAQDLSSGFVPLWKELYVILPVGRDQRVRSDGHLCRLVRRDALGRAVHCIRMGNSKEYKL